MIQAGDCSVRRRVAYFRDLPRPVSDRRRSVQAPRNLSISYHRVSLVFYFCSMPAALTTKAERSTTVESTPSTSMAGRVR